AGVYADAEIGWHVAASATVRTKVVSLRNAFGRLPSRADGAQTVILPLNAIVTRVMLDVGGGAGNYAIVSGDAGAGPLLK
ncbi:hypothetical protein, partial [Klebsiella pneumoniae]